MSIPLIRNISVRAVRLPMPKPHRTASGEITESPLVLVDMTTDAGEVGRSLIFTYTPDALLPTARLIENIGSWLIGQALVPADLDRLLATRLRLLGPQGLTGMAAAALDMAAWDALAHTSSLSLARLLGASAQSIPIYGGMGFDGAESCAEQTHMWREQGVTAVKPKIGYPTLSEDLAVVRAIREAGGAEMSIMVDYNQSLDPAEARRRLHALDDEGLSWIEEPVGAHDFIGLASLATEIRTPIQAGENWWGPSDFRTAIASGASDHLMPDVMKVGGVSGWMRVAGMAHANALPVSNHLFPEISAQLMCATPTAFRLEYADWWNAILTEPLKIENGFACIDDSQPGSGVSWDEQAVARYLVE